MDEAQTWITDAAGPKCTIFDLSGLLLLYGNHGVNRKGVESPNPHHSECHCRKFCIWALHGIPGDHTPHSESQVVESYGFIFERMFSLRAYLERS